MIVKMKKVFVVTRAASREPLLEELRNLGVMHLEPVDPSAAAPEELSGRLTRIRQAGQAIASVAPAGRKPEMDADTAANEILAIFHRTHENRTRLTALHRESGQLNLWGELRLKQLDALAEAGLSVKFYSVPQKQLGEVAAECAAALGSLPGKRLLVGIAQRHGEPTLPEDAVEIELPKRDLPDIRAEAAEVDKTMVDDAKRLACLANLSNVLTRRAVELASEVEYARALAGAMKGENLFAVQGWVPTDHADTLAADLSDRGITSAVDSREPADSESPPTLIRYPRWARPIKGLFDILGTVPGYTEFDVAVAFMIFLPIFSAILISDAGYGLLYALLPIVLYRRIKAVGIANLAHLIIVIGVLSIIWGVITCSFFGFDFSGLLGRQRPWVVVDTFKMNMDFLMYLSITIGAVHLSLAHLWKAKAAFPRLTLLSEVGWATWLWGMYGLVKMFLLKDPFAMDVFPHYPWMLIVGGALAIAFSHPSRNVFKSLGLGLANFPLSAIGSFGDTVSYVRLMALGVAGSVLAVTFNQMGGRLPIYGTIPVLIVGHALNVALTIVALLAHGVRLNMLEFSNNLGMQWSGQAYMPFANKQLQEN